MQSELGFVRRTVLLILAPKKLWLPFGPRMTLPLLALCAPMPSPYFVGGITAVNAVVSFVGNAAKGAWWFLQLTQ